MNNIKFMMVFHNHQPCDNFGWTIEDAFNKAYKPFIQTLYKYPQIKVVLHYSGSLIEWIEKNRHEFFEVLKKMIQRDQIELLSGGFHEPIMTIIPKEDAAMQLSLMNDKLKKVFGITAKGTWLTERVWENDLSDIFIKQGLEYTILDQNHFLKSGVKDNPVTGYYQIKDKPFYVFAGDKTLRYIMPFGKAIDVIKYLKDIAEKKENNCIVFSDDGEKFGFWPHTYDWVYNRRWLDKFFSELINNSDTITTVLSEDLFSSVKVKKITNIPSASYSEMEKWADGDFSNFFVKYPQINFMHKRMLNLSKRINQKSSLDCDKQKIEHAKNHLHKSQAGCAYWHGVFGGVYLNHLREGVYRHIIKAENIIEDKKDILDISSEDLIKDSKEHVKLSNDMFNIFVDTHKRGDIIELDNKMRSLNMIGTIARRKEEYHKDICKKNKFGLVRIKNAIKNKEFFNIHSILSAKDRDVLNHLVYDDGISSCFRDFFLKSSYSFLDYCKAIKKDRYELSDGSYEIQKEISDDKAKLILTKKEDILDLGVKFDLKKEITISLGNSFCVAYTLCNLSDKKVSGYFATECNWSMFNKDFTEGRCFEKVKHLNFNDQWSGMCIEHDFSDAMDVWATPIYTVSGSDKGFEKNYQNIRFLIRKKIELKKEEKIKIEHIIRII